MADSQDEGGICMIDAVMEAGELSHIKILANNLVTCKRAYNVTITTSREVFFTYVVKWQIGEVIKGQNMEYVEGSGKDETHNSYQKGASFVQPTGLCSEGDSLYVTDNVAGAFQTNS